MSHIESFRNASDDQLALDFIDSRQKELRYVDQWGKWMTYDGIKWDFDNKLAIYTHARKYLRDISTELREAIYSRLASEISTELSPAKQEDARLDARSKARNRTLMLQSASCINHVVSLGRSDHRMAMSVDAWDSDPWLLNTPGGTVDLRTGKMRKHNPLDYIRKVTAATPDHKAQPRRWIEFLMQIMQGDEEMVRYLQKVFGYCLVGETKEHQMYFAYGTGKNGKGVTLSTIRSLLGGYGMEAALETFIINDTSRHPTELADLQGARLVTCGETEEGARWAEARIKMLTGGDPVKARFMRQDFFQYKPQFKLFLAGNHKPRLANVDQAIERRFRLIPFTYTVPEEDRDTDLEQKLKSEWPAILAWAIDGCLAWQSEGLQPPERVATATKGYLNQEDAIANWVEECATISADAFSTVKDLYASWAEWARSNGETIGTKRTLTQHLEDREPIMGIKRGRRADGIGFKGLELRTPSVD